MSSLGQEEVRGGWEWAEARLDKDQDPGRVEGVLGKCLPHRGHGESFHTLRWPCLAFRDVPGPERPDRAKLEATADVFLQPLSYRPVHWKKKSFKTFS